MYYILSAGSIRCSVVDVRTIVGLNRLGDVRVQTWMDFGTSRAHKMCLSSSGSSHSAQRHTYAGKTTEWFTCMERSCSLFDERYVLVRCRGYCGSRAPGGAGNTRSFLFFCCFGFRGFAQSSVLCLLGLLGVCWLALGWQMGLSLRVLTECVPMCLCWHFGVKYLSVCRFRDMLRQIFGNCGLAVSPGKPRVPYCEERPGAALQEGPDMCCGVAVSPRQPRVPHCEEWPCRTLQEGPNVCLRVSRPPTHPARG